MNKLDRLTIEEGFLHVSSRDVDNDSQERASVPVMEVLACYVTTETRYAGDAGGNTPAVLRIVFTQPKLAAIVVRTSFATAMRHKKALVGSMMS